MLQPTVITSGGIASFYGPSGGGWVAGSLAANAGHLVGTTRRQGQEGPFDAQLYSGTIDLGTSPHLLAYRYDGAGRHKITVDDQTETSMILPPVQAVGAPDMQLFVGRADNLYWHNFGGKLAELVVVGRDLADREVAAYRAYAAHEWGGLPCKATPVPGCVP